MARDKECRRDSLSQGRVGTKDGMTDRKSADVLRWTAPPFRTVAIHGRTLCGNVIHPDQPLPVAEDIAESDNSCKERKEIEVIELQLFLSAEARRPLKNVARHLAFKLIAGVSKQPDEPEGARRRATGRKTRI